MATTKIRSSVQLYVDLNLDANSKKIINLASPTAATDAATKEYVDSKAAGLDAKESVKVKSLGGSPWSVAPTYNNGTNGVGATLTFGASWATYFDSSSFVVGDRILVTDAVAAQNGIYEVTSLSAGVSLVLTRTTDFNSITNITPNSFVFVETGNTYADSGWTMSADSITAIGTSAINWVQFSGAGQITAGNGLTKNGNTIDAVGTTDRITVNADSIDIASTYVGQSSITTLGTIGTGTWQGSLINSTYGGTGVNNGGRTITVAGNFATAGAFAMTLTATAATSVTLPTSGTLATLAGSETLTNKTINLSNNTLSGTLAQFNTALSDDDFVGLAATQTLTNKTLTAPNVTGLQIRDSSIVFEGSVDDTFETTLTVANPTADVTVTIPAITGTLITTGDTGTVTNTMLAGSIANAKLANSTITINGSAISLGGSISGLAITSGTLALFAATTSAQLAGVISDETGSGALVFANTPTLTTPKINTINGVNGTDVINLYTNTTSTINIGSASLATTNVYGTNIVLGSSISDITLVTGTLKLPGYTANTLLYLDASNNVTTVSWPGTPVTGAVATWANPDTFSVNQTATSISNLQVWLNGMLLALTDDYTPSFAANVISVNINDSFAATSADKVIFAYYYK